MSGRPRATIVVPVLRQRDPWLRECLLSALGQTVACEVLAVVSPRTPSSNREVLHRLAHRHEELQILLEGPEGGFADAINTGFRAARAGRVGLLLSDDRLDPRAVEACLEHDADIVSTGLTMYAADGRTVLLRHPRSRATYEALDDLEARASYLGHFLLLGREAALRVGGVDGSVGLTGADDYDLIWTMLEHGATVGIVEQALYEYRDHAGERLTLRDRAAQLADLEKILRKHGVSGERKERLWSRTAGGTGSRST